MEPTFERDALPVSVRIVYRTVALTRLAGAKNAGYYRIEPGAEIHLTGIFLVRGAAYDEIALDASILYTKRDDGLYRVVVRKLPNATVLETQGPATAVHELETPVATTMLW